jgi:hypothetical protein
MLQVGASGTEEEEEIEINDKVSTILVSEHQIIIGDICVQQN